MDYSILSFTLTEQQYNFLLPVCRTKLLASNGKFKFIGSKDDFEYNLERCKYLDMDLTADLAGYGQQLEQNNIDNKTVRYKQIHH